MSGKIAVVGSGTMGRGIAQVAAIAGHPVALHDVSESALDEARRAIDQSVAKGIEKGKTPPDAADRVRGGLEVTTDLEAAVHGTEVVIEAVPESLDLKLDIFARVAKCVSDECILATNTSSLPITAIAAAIPRPERFAGMHFFNPVPIMKLVEIVAGIETSAEVVHRLRSLSEAWGKQAIVVQDSPGFATSRLGLVIGLEAIRMLETGVASAEEIDRAMELGYGHPMGPLRLTDLVGLDVRLAIAEHLHREVGEQFRPPALLRKLVRAGRLGKKSGRGFYEW